MPVIKPALIYTKQGEVVEVDQKIVEAVDGFRVPDGFVRKGYPTENFCDSPPQYPHSSVSSVTVSVPYRELL